MSSPLRAYFQLLRVPNLFTVPGDPLCGFLLASGGVWGWRAVPAIAASLLAYGIGLVLNDLADFDEDRRERPNRPLPSGAVTRTSAGWLCGFLFVGMEFTRFLLGLPASDGALFLLAAILLYNLLAKKSRVFGPVVMGCCRGLSVCLGALASGGLPVRTLLAPGFGHPDPRVAWPAFMNYLGSLSQAVRASPPPFLAASVIGLYIAGVTILARHETRDPRIPPLIGRLIRALLFLQAGFCLLAGGPAGWAAAAVLLALWPLSRLVASQFYAS